MRQKFNTLATQSFFDAHEVITSPSLLDLSGDVHLEIGSGKGKFITDMARDFPNKTFIAFEMNRHVAYYIVLKKEELKLNNLIIIIDNIQSMDLYIKPHTIHTIYLNFSDPWPKAKHHKRRLSHPNQLKRYINVLKEDGIIEMRTDHQKLYMESCFYFQTLFKDISYDDDLELMTYYSEYEMKKRPLGPIYHIKAKVSHELL
jgi:tRNA (guanine-N7-)-methyltransferase